MNRIKASWPLLMALLFFVAVTTGVDAQRLSANSFPSGQSELGEERNLTFKRSGKDSVTIVGDGTGTTIGADTTSSFYTWGASAIGITVTTVSQNNGDTVFVLAQKSVDGQVWTSAAYIDTLVTAGTTYDMVLGQNANPAATLATYNAWRLMRLIVRHGDVDAATDSTKVKNVRVLRLFPPQ